MRSPQITGEEFPWPGTSTFQATFSVELQRSGRPVSSESPIPEGPRQRGQWRSEPGTGGTAGPAGLPILQIHPSLRCNLACRHCYSVSGPQASLELDAATVTAAIEDAAALGYRVVSVSGVALPAFWLGLMLQLVIALDLGWLPLGGRLGLTATPPAPITHLLLVDAALRGEWRTLGDALRHAVLPVVTLCFPALASIMRVNRAEMLETLQQDYITTARAQGFSGVRVVTRYALRNAMLPTLAMIGLRYGWMLGGTILVETVFDWPGIGLYAVSSALASDFQPVMGVTTAVARMLKVTVHAISSGVAAIVPCICG